MNTAVLLVDPVLPDPNVLQLAGKVILGGGLVAFPTETVYGLGANALNAAAVARIFEAKGRPATNPLIVHVADPDQALNVAALWPETAAKLSAQFWPGPLTIVVPKQPKLPDLVTAGGPTVAVRCPAHPVAGGLIRAAGVPIAAPSANRSTELSPTRAEHAVKGLGGRIEMVLDGGACPGGIESTVVDVTGETVRLLRPGLITVRELEGVVGRVEVGAREAEIARSPGQMAKHYSPRTPMVLVDSNEEGATVVAELRNENASLGWLTFGTFRGRLATVAMPTDPGRYAAMLYEALHASDEGNVDRIVVTLPPNTPEWLAVRDRLTRAAAESPDAASGP